MVQSFGASLEPAARARRATAPHTHWRPRRLRSGRCSLIPPRRWWENGHFDALCPPTEDGWWVSSHGGRLRFHDGSSAIEVAVDAPLRWTRDGADLSFDEAIAAVPRALHGWMALAALIGLRHCVGGLATGIALPAGRQRVAVDGAARRTASSSWMESLARLDGVDVPASPTGVDDGLDGAGTV